LGIVTEAILRLVPNPRQRTTLLFGVQDVSSAVEIYSAVYEHFSSELISYEFFNHMSMELVGRNLPQAHIPISGDYPGYVLCELASGDEERDFIGGIDTALGRWMGSGVIGEPVIAQSEAQRRVLWAVREGIPEAEQREGFSLKHDVAVPISKIAALCGSIRSIMESNYSVARPRLSIFGHIGEGNLHINILPAVGVKADRFKLEMKSLSQCVEDAAVAVGGSFSAEHGIGQSRIEKLARYRGGVDIALMKAIKAALDPEGLMNPGKILSGEEIPQFE
jgi:FAD/FMN-containing dehydrogenase